jgi:hypothetical protein
VFWLAVKGDGFGAAFSHAFSGELEAVGVVDEAIENGVGDRGVPNGSMPGIHGELTCDDGGCAAMAVARSEANRRWSRWKRCCSVVTRKLSTPTSRTTSGAFRMPSY